MMDTAVILGKIRSLVELFVFRERRYRRIRLPFKSMADLDQLPMMTRADLKRFSLDKPLTGAFNVTATSGSTSSRLLVAHSREAYLAHVRRLARIYRSVGAGPGALCLNVCSHELNSGGRLMEAGYKAAGAGVIPLGEWRTPRQVDEAVWLVKRLRPAFVNAYTNQLFDLFSALGNRHSVRVCVVNGEPLWPSYRERIEKMGGVRVHDHYGAMEVSGFAIALRPDDAYMKVFAEGLLLEVLADDGTIAAEGEGELLVTDLENRCMPFIRYRLGDRVALVHRRGAQGVRVLSRIDDSFLVNGVVVMKLPLIRMVGDLLGHPGFFFAVTKNAVTYKDTLTLYVPEPRAATALAGLEVVLGSLGVDRCAVVKGFDGHVPRTVNGKIRYFIDARDNGR